MSVSKKAPEDNPDGGAPQGGALKNELVWTVRRAMILFRCWTTPVNAIRIDTFGVDDGVSARTLALFLIVALAFAVRGDAPSASSGVQAAFTAIAGGLAVALSSLLNIANKAFKFKVSEPIVLSAYTSTILVMFAYVVIDSIYWNNRTYLDIAESLGSTQREGKVALGTIVGALGVLFVLLIKSAIIDKNRLNRQSLWQAIFLTVGSGFIVWIVATMSPKAFDWLTRCASHSSLWKLWSCF